MLFPTIVIRHRRENLKKCSLRGLEGRSDFCFLKYPIDTLPNLDHYVMLAIDGPPLTIEDQASGILLLDATWRYADKMIAFVDSHVDIPRRSIPPGYITAYPRRQDDCIDPTAGLASVEALYIAYKILDKPTEGLLDNYHWREQFLQINGLT